MRHLQSIGLLFFLCAPAHAHACWEEAGSRYRIDPHLLYAIARCESSLRPTAINRSHQWRTRTYDIGLMQINSSNLRGLRGYGIGERELLDACTNINVGAWILSNEIRRHGLTWEAVGAYNAACTELKGRDCRAARSRYAWCVYRNLPPEYRRSASRRASHELARVAQGEPMLAVRVAP